MDLKEFYNKIQGDYEGTLSRLYKESLVEKFVGKFLSDKSFEELSNNMKTRNYEEIFRAVHTLKGVSANLGFTKLYTVSSELTEAVRHEEYANIDSMYEAVKEEYNKTVQIINEFIKI